MVITTVEVLMSSLASSPAPPSTKSSSRHLCLETFLRYIAHQMGWDTDVRPLMQNGICVCIHVCMYTCMCTHIYVYVFEYGLYEVYSVVFQDPDQTPSFAKRLPTRR